MFPIESSSVLTELQVFGGYATSHTDHHDHSHHGHTDHHDHHSHTGHGHTGHGHTSQNGYGGQGGHAGHNGHGGVGVDDAERSLSAGQDSDAAAPGCPADREVTDLRRKLATLPGIEQAKGILMSSYGISADVAFDVLRRWSMSNNTKLSTLCATLVAEASQPSTVPCQSVREALARWETPT